MPSPWNKKYRTFCRCLVITAMVAGSFLGTVCVSASAQALPFSPGEEVRYDVRWQMYKAGEVVVRVLPFSKVKGNPAWHFELLARSNKFIDLFFKVRDHVQAFAARDFSGSRGYQYSGRGKKKKEIQVEFFPHVGKAAYSNFEEKRDPIKIPARCFDPLSSYFKMRSFDLRTGDTLSFSVTDGKKAFIQKGDILGREHIEINSRTYDTIVVVPWVTHFSGVFKKSKDPTVRVWITDDEQRLPVRIRIRVKVGSIYFDIKSHVPPLAGSH